MYGNQTLTRITKDLQADERRRAAGARRSAAAREPKDRGPSDGPGPMVAGGTPHRRVVRRLHLPRLGRIRRVFGATGA